MDLPSTARSSNIKDSLKKFFKDEVETGKGITVTFDKFLAPPAGANNAVRWAGVKIGSRSMNEPMATQIVEVFLCTRNDGEGYKLNQLRDTVVGTLTDTTKTDSFKRITFYKSYPSQAWESIGTLIVQDILESEETDAPDGTKFIVLTIRLRLASGV